MTISPRCECAAPSPATRGDRRRSSDATRAGADGEGEPRRPRRRRQLRRVRRPRDRRPARAPRAFRAARADPGRRADRGTARINGDLFGERSACAVLSYDYTVLAGTQGAIGHQKKDRLFELIERLRLPTVFFAEGGGGRPGDTDFAVVSGLHVRAFALWARLSGIVPRIAIVSGRCFAGNAVIAGCSDLIVATENASLGMGGPAMIEGGGLGIVDADEVGPVAMQSANGVIDLAVADEAEAVAVDQAPALLLPGRHRRGRGARPGAPARARPGAPATRLRRRAGDRDDRRRGLGHLPSGGLRPRDGDLPGPDRGPPGGGDRQQHDADGRCDHQRRSRQGSPPAPALRRIRAAGPLPDRHPRDDGRPRRRGDGARPPLFPPLHRRRRPERADGRGDPAQGLRPRRPGDGRQGRCASRC